jgi:FtsH-binding integral membrane protein
VIGGLGYILLAWGMLNSLYLFTLGQTLQPLRSILYAALLNIIVGFLLSRFVGYEYSVVGMLCGGGLFAFLTVRATHAYFKNLDYYYYASY